LQAEPIRQLGAYASASHTLALKLQRQAADTIIEN